MTRFGTNLKRFQSELLLGAVGLLPVGAAYGQQLTVELDPNQTTVARTLGVLDLDRFLLFAAEIVVCADVEEVDTYRDGVPEDDGPGKNE